MDWLWCGIGFWWRWIWLSSKNVTIGNSSHERNLFCYMYLLLDEPHIISFTNLKINTGIFASFHVPRCRNERRTSTNLHSHWFWLKLELNVNISVFGTMQHFICSFIQVAGFSFCYFSPSKWRKWETVSIQVRTHYYNVIWNFFQLKKATWAMWLTVQNTNYNRVYTLNNFFFHWFKTSKQQ